MLASPHCFLVIAALGASPTHAGGLSPQPSQASRATLECVATTEPTTDVPFPDRAPAPIDGGIVDPRVERDWLQADAYAPGETPAPPVPAGIGPCTVDRALHGMETDGTPWVRTPMCMARFGIEGAAYTPFFGSEAPRTWPVRFSVAEAAIGGENLSWDRSAPAVRHLDEVRYERGGFVEHYEIGRDSIEQLFTFRELPARGELLLRISVDTDLVARETADAIEFANDRGTVRYGRATALDATGASVSAPTSWIGDQIVIRVPAEFVATASLPLVIDPLISTFAAGSPAQYSLPRCAFDATFGRWLIVYDDEFSSTVDNVAWRLVGVLDGQTIAAGILGNGQWLDSRCANNNATNQFLVVAREGLRIWGQSISAANGAVGTAFQITDRGEDPVVGGDPYPSTPSHFLVAWTRPGFQGSNEVRCRLVGSTAPVAPEQTLGSGSADAPLGDLALSTSNGGSYWNLAWTRDRVFFPDIVAARVSWSGSATSGTLILPSGLVLSGRHLSVSPALSGSDLWAVAYDRNESGYLDDVFVATVNGLTPTATKNVSSMAELAGNGARVGQQHVPQIDTDGRSFALAYLDRSNEPYVVSSYGRLRIATLTPVGSQLMLSEVVTADWNESSAPGLASTWGAGLAWRLQLAVYGRLDNGGVQGSLYDNALFTSFCHPGYDGVATCPCGNAPSQYGRGCNNTSNTGGAKLYATGISSVSSDSMGFVTLNLPTNQTVFYYQGTSPLTTAAFSGRGVRCVGGTQVLLYTKPSYPLGTQAYSTAPNAGDPRIAARSAQLGMPILAGQTRYYYAAYRPVGTSGGGNGQAACTTWFSSNVTQSVQAVWIP